MSTELMTPENGRILSTSSIIKVGEVYYKTHALINPNFSIESFDPVTKSTFTLKEGYELSKDIAYLIGEYYYLYRGKLSSLKGFDEILPGIYYDDIDTMEYIIKDPETDEEKDEYTYNDKITRKDVDEIRNAVLNNEVIIFNTPDMNSSSIPPENIQDDILKKLIKRAIVNKGIDMDRYKIRFASKNMLFNTKQVLRGDNKLSMLLFDRCAEAFNLKYTIIVEEGGGEIVGRSLDEPLVLSSHDFYDANVDFSETENITE